MPQMNFSSAMRRPLVPGEASGRSRAHSFPNPAAIFSTITRYRSLAPLWNDDTVVLTQNIGWPAECLA